MSDETLRDFVVRNRGLPKDEAFEQVLLMPKVRAWIGQDAGRRDRLEREFERLWAEVAVPAPAPTGGTAATATLVRPASTVHVGPARGRADERVVQAVQAPARALRRRRERFLCSECGSYDIFSETDGEAVVVRCQQCKHEFADLLALVPVVEVGPVELFFGRGREMWIKVGSLVALWTFLWILLRVLA